MEVAFYVSTDKIAIPIYEKRIYEAPSVLLYYVLCGIWN